MGVSLSVAVVIGVEISESRGQMRRAREGLDNHATVEAWSVGDCESVVVFVRATHFHLAAGVHDVRCAVADFGEITARHEGAVDAMRREIADALAAIGVVAGPARWLVVCDAS